MGPAAALLELAEIGALELLVSDACIEELREVLTRPPALQNILEKSVRELGDIRRVDGAA